jgi:hypothetical protein
MAIHKRFVVGDWSIELLPVGAEVVKHANGSSEMVDLYDVVEARRGKEVAAASGIRTVETAGAYFNRRIQEESELVKLSRK